MAINRPLLCSVPQEVLDKIAFELVSDTPHGPPSSLLPLLVTCKDLHHKLSPANCPDLFARIFKAKFDHVPVVRRAFKPRSSQYLDQLMDYSRLLQTIHSRDLDSDIDNTLFMALIMMMENDGKNKAQLEWAGIDEYLDMFLTERMHEDLSNGWPSESAQNSCALWLMWMLTTEEKLLAETTEQRERIVRLVLPYVLLPYRYASAEAPPSHFLLPFDNPDEDNTFSVLTAHGEYPLYRDSSRTWGQVHYGSRPDMSPPLITIAAKLLYFSRREIVPFSIPPHLLPTRADAIQAGVHDIGPTVEDMVEFNSHRDTKLVRETRWDWADKLTKEEWEREMSGVAEFGKRLKAPSVAWDNDWWRMRMCGSPWLNDRVIGPVFNPGSLAGLWQGRMLIPSERDIISFVTVPECPAEFSEALFLTTTMPVFMRLQEHHCMAPNTPVNCGGDDDIADDGLANAYFPDGMWYSQTTNSDGSGSVTVFADGESSEYETYVPGRPNLHDSETCENCIAIEQEREQVRAKREAAPYEHLFSRVGLGRMDSEIDGPEGPLPPVLPEHDEGKIFPCDGIEDIIITGKTDERHGQAWNHFTYYGRVRQWDGLIGILRISRDAWLGSLFFYGYIVGGQNFVGNWRVASVDVSLPAWESAFTMSRRDEE